MSQNFVHVTGTIQQAHIRPDQVAAIEPRGENGCIVHLAGGSAIFIDRNANEVLDEIIEQPAGPTP